MKNLFRSLHNIISYQTWVKKTGFTFFQIFWPREVTGCHGNSHHPKLHLFLFFLDMLSVHIKIK